MAAQAERALQQPEPCGNPVEMLVIGCRIGVADGYASALRNQGQAAHLKTAEDLDSLKQQLNSEPCDLVILNAEAAGLVTAEAVDRIRAANPRTSTAGTLEFANATAQEIDRAVQAAQAAYATTCLLYTSDAADED